MILSKAKFEQIVNYRICQAIDERRTNERIESLERKVYDLQCEIRRIRGDKEVNNIDIVERKD